MPSIPTAGASADTPDRLPRLTYHLLTEAQIRQSIGDTAGANATARELVAFAARTQLDRVLEHGLTITRSTACSSQPPSSSAHVSRRPEMVCEPC